MESLGYALALVMGTTLGLMGAGGSILTVPILVYFFAIPPVAATTYSLLVVGSAALVGAITYWYRGLVDSKAALIFALPASLMVLVTRDLIMPELPDPIFHLSKNTFIMCLFASLMLLAAGFMLFGKNKESESTEKPPLTPSRLFLLLAGSAAAGLLTGLVGAGGGFLIVPLLISLFGLPMKMAVGTSLSIIALNCCVGFHSDLINGTIIDWELIGLFLGITLLGMILGTYAARTLDGAKLRMGFGVVIVLVGSSILMELRESVETTIDLTDDDHEIAVSSDRGEDK